MSPGSAGSTEGRRVCRGALAPALTRKGSNPRPCRSALAATSCRGVFSAPTPASRPQRLPFLPGCPPALAVPAFPTPLPWRQPILDSRRMPAQQQLAAALGKPAGGCCLRLVSRLAVADHLLTAQQTGQPSREMLMLCISQRRLRCSGGQRASGAAEAGCGLSRSRPQ